MDAKGRIVKITLEGSFCGCSKRQRATLRGLGLKRRGQSLVLRETAPVAGMLRKVEHLVKVEG